MVSHPELGSDPPIGSDRESGCDNIHNVFHVSMLRRYRSDPLHVVSSEIIKLCPNLTYEEELIKILTREVKELRNK